MANLLSTASNLFNTVKKNISPYLNAPTQPKASPVFGVPNPNISLPKDIVSGQNPVFTRTENGQVSYPGEVFDSRPLNGSGGKLGGPGVVGNISPTMPSIPSSGIIPGKPFISGNPPSEVGSYPGGNNSGGGLTGLEAPKYQLPDMAAEQKRIEDGIAEMQKVIMARQAQLEAGAQESSDMNQSTIRGNLGRVFGNNFDTSEASPVTAEQNRLGKEKADISKWAQQALSDNSMKGLEQLTNALSQGRTDYNQAQNMGFQNVLAQAGLTGAIGDKTVLPGLEYLSKDKQQEFMNGITSGQFSSDMLQRAFDNLLASNKEKSTNDQNAIDNLLRYGQLTGNVGGRPTLDMSQLLGYVPGNQGLQGNIPTLQARTLDETIAKNNAAETAKNTQLNINQQKADAYSKRVTDLANKVVSGKATSKELSQYQAITAYNKALETNANVDLFGTGQKVSDTQLEYLAGLAFGDEKKN